MWNSRSQKIIGLAMSQQICRLCNEYELVDEDNAKKQTSYILQFLWPDLTLMLLVPTSQAMVPSKASS